MLRVGKLLVLLVLPSVFLLAGCGGDCSIVSDCPGSQICYKGECREALLESTQCNTDQNCGEAPAAGGVRAYLCVAGRCRINPNLGNTTPVTPTDAGSSSPADSGSTGADAGPTD